ncbi:MAG: extracellular solute-binding protein [Spirochaetales bacterium]|nr:extracellular solute-binding protein [Spirochaetales bacterium]
MFKKRGKILLSLLLVALALSSFNGCSDSAAKDDKFEVSIFRIDSLPQPDPDNKIYKMLKDEFGVTFKFEFLAGDLKQKLGVMTASGDYPDLISYDPLLKEAGALIPLEDLIKDNCPNLYAHYKPFWNQVKEPDDGHMYCMPDYGRFYGGVSDLTYEGNGFWIQKAVLAEFGYPKPTTLDEYFDLIEKYKAKYPTIDGQPTIGFEILNYQWRNFVLRNPPQFLAGFPNDGDVTVDPITYKAEIFANKDIAKRYYKKLNEVNAKGLINKDTFVNNYDQYMANMASGRVLGVPDQHWQFGKAEETLKLKERFERTYVPLGLTYDKSIKDHYRDRSLLNLHRGYGITVDCKDPLRILKLFDALLDEKWQKIFDWGIEGEDYMVNEKGRFYKTPEQLKTMGDVPWQSKNKALALYESMPKREGFYSDGNSVRDLNQPEVYFSQLSAYDKEFFGKYGISSPIEFLNAPPENLPCYPAWTIDLGEGSDAQIANQQMQDLGVKYLPRIILAAPADFEKIWQEYVDAFDKINVKAYEDKINKEIQFRVKNW